MAVIFEFRSIYSVSVFLLTFNLFLFNADVNWLPGSASPYGYSRQQVKIVVVVVYLHLQCTCEWPDSHSIYSCVQLS